MALTLSFRFHLIVGHREEVPQVGVHVEVADGCRGTQVEGELHFALALFQDRLHSSVQQTPEGIFARVVEIIFSDLNVLLRIISHLHGARLSELPPNRPRIGGGAIDQLHQCSRAQKCHLAHQRHMTLLQRQRVVDPLRLGHDEDVAERHQSRVLTERELHGVHRVEGRSAPESGGDDRGAILGLRDLRSALGEALGDIEELEERLPVPEDAVDRLTARTAELVRLASFPVQDGLDEALVSVELLVRGFEVRHVRVSLVVYEVREIECESVRV